MLTIVTWLWGTKYSATDVERLRHGVHRHLTQDYEFLAFTDNESLWSLPGYWPIEQADLPLVQEKGCFARLRLFDPKWQYKNSIEEDRIVNMDLDTVITGPLDLLFDRPESFMILQGANAANPCPFNGSLMMLRAGAHPEVWADFSLEKSKKIPCYEFPDDQGWIHYKLPNASGWKVGSQSGVYAFQKPGWPKGEALPSDARMVVFPGHRSPEKFKHLPWVESNWR